MTYCIDFHDINNMVNPCKGIKPLAVNFKDKYIPSDQEIELVRANCNAGQRLLIDIVWQTGARINEIMNLRAEHLDWENDRMALFTKKSRNANRTYRKIKIPQCLLEAGIEVDTYKTPNKGLIFPQFQTHPKFIEKFQREHKIKNRWSWHNLRHKYASEACANEMPLYILSYQLGHASLSTTEIYLSKIGIYDQYYSNGSDGFSSESNGLFNDLF